MAGQALSSFGSTRAALPARAQRQRAAQVPLAEHGAVGRRARAAQAQAGAGAALALYRTPALSVVVRVGQLGGLLVIRLELLAER